MRSAPTIPRSGMPAEPTRSFTAALAMPRSTFGPRPWQYEEGGGGWVSLAYGIHGGFTIANGVTIENARSGSGNDTLTGNDAANRLESGAGTDVLSGGLGNDVLIGGAGEDTLTGGAGADRFVFQTNGDSAVGLTRDTISDFVRGSDKIDLAALNAGSFIGTGLFSGVAGQVRYAAFDGATIVELNSNGDRIADFQVELAGNLPLAFSDFAGLEIDATAKAGGGKKAPLANNSPREEGAYKYQSDHIRNLSPEYHPNDYMQM